MLRNTVFLFMHWFASALHSMLCDMDEETLINGKTKKGIRNKVITKFNNIYLLNRNLLSLSRKTVHVKRKIRHDIS